ncbi:MAG: hypothetical protein K9N49_03360 [Candidatus Marinimicrobia bacterium]|nr:hypothetical protein [Candidatus Neomarinimicrobiota bacterium]
MNTKRNRQYLGLNALGLALALSGGCQLEERLAWSPDGSVAAVRTGADLRLATPDGVLSEPIATDVAAMAWLPDGSGLALHRTVTVLSWSDVVSLVPRSETRLIEILARGLPELIEAGLELTGGDLEALTTQYLKPMGLLELPLAESLLYLHDNQPEDWQRLLEWAHAPDDAADAPAERDDQPRVVVHEIAILPITAKGAAGEPTVIERTLQRLAQPKPSPVAPVVAYLRNDELILAPLHGTATTYTPVAERVSGSFAWSADGRSLAFARRHSEKWESSGLNVASIERRTVLDENGAVQLKDRELLAVSLFAFLPRVRCLPDGRILFAGHQGNLPATPADAREARFYLVGPDGIAPVPTPPGALPTDLSSFTLAPDGRRLAVAEAGSDALAVVDLASGTVELIAPARGARSRTLPAWRANGDLYYAALADADTPQPVWMRRSAADGTHEAFSATWPADLNRALLHLRSLSAPKGQRN